MELLENVSVNKNKTGIVEVKLSGSCNIIKISAECEKSIEIKYAQNSVFDVLHILGTTVLSENGRQELEIEQPITATHIYLFAEDAEISDISVYENEGVNLLNLYPKCIDIPLKENYYIDMVSVFTSPKGFSHYSLYTSLDGRDFDLVAVKDNNIPCDAEKGDVFKISGKEARIIRVYYEYNSESPEQAFERLEYIGKPSGNPIIERPEINICNFNDSEYNVPISDNDASDEVYGIVERRLGKEYKTWFDFCIGKKKQYDYFNISYENNKIKIIGNTGVAIAAGLNYYLKYFCKVNISQVGDQPVMPNEMIVPEKPVYRETKARIRYAYNYCTHSYTSAFWGDSEWRREIDWLALNGVNCVLDITAQEEVWRRFLKCIGYSHGEIKNFIVGPAYYAWMFMANMFEHGGPVSDAWFEKRCELARKNQLIMRKLGIYPVLQGYSGMIPTDIKKYNPEIEVIPQGDWCALQRPHMIKTDCPSYAKYAKIFYEVQKEVYGEAVFFATDPFHEGGITGGMSPRMISKTVLEEMLKANPDAVWIIQSWQANPTSELLAGLGEVKDGRQHALVLDLYAEKIPNYSDGKSGNPNHGYSEEFDGTPWVYCMLNNFGGRSGLHGHLDNMVKEIPKIINECKYFAGIGMTCEASENNPVLYDFLFESVWCENTEETAVSFDINKWLCSYVERRYGGESENSEKAWNILAETVYKAKYNMIGQGAPESMVNARPEFNLKKSSMWGNSLIGYNPDDFEKAAQFLLKDYNKFCKSDGYMYDVVSVFEQVLSNRALSVYNLMSEAYNNKDINKFEKYSNEFLNIADEMEKVTANCEYFRISRFMNFVHNISKGYDDFGKRLLMINAKSIISVWWSYTASELAQEHEYSNRQWSGMIGGFYKKRWECYINEVKKELKGEEYNKNIKWFEWEWSWARSQSNYSEIPAMDKNDFYKFLTDISGETVI